MLLAQGHDESRWWGLDSRLTGYKSDGLPSVPSLG